MKPFDLEKAKNGAAVCMRDGTPVRILDFNFCGNRILYKFRTKQDEERTNDVNKNGIADYNSTLADSYADLFMAPIYGYMVLRKNNIAKQVRGGKLHSELAEAIKEKETSQKENNEYRKFFSLARVELIQEIDLLKQQEIKPDVNRKSKDLHLVLKNKWFDMIVKGDKKEEYREMSKHWDKLIWKDRKKIENIVFHRGYTSITHTVKCKLIKVGTGNPEWGAERGKIYYVLSF